MGERNACVYCEHETGKLANGDSGPWCNHFNEPIMGYSRGAPDLYAGSSIYSHSGRARDHQNMCSGFKLDPRMQDRWAKQFATSSPSPSARAQSSFSPSVVSSGAGVVGFVLKSVAALILTVVMFFAFGLLFGGGEDGLFGGLVVTFLIGLVLCFTWKSLGIARFIIPALPLLLFMMMCANA